MVLFTIYGESVIFLCYVCSQLEPVKVGVPPIMNRKFVIDYFDLLF